VIGKGGGWFLCRRSAFPAKNTPVLGQTLARYAGRQDVREGEAFGRERTGRDCKPRSIECDGRNVLRLVPFGIRLEHDLDAAIRLDPTSQISASSASSRSSASLGSSLPVYQAAIYGFHNRSVTAGSVSSESLPCTVAKRSYPFAKFMFLMKPCNPSSRAKPVIFTSAGCEGFRYSSIMLTILRLRSPALRLPLRTLKPSYAPEPQRLRRPSSPTFQRASA
jgi:hypothetical protein